MTNKAKINELASWLTWLLGFAALGLSVYRFPFGEIGSGFVVFALLAVLFSSYLQIHLPRTTFYFTISDTLIFTALFLYGSEAAIVLATVESLFTSFIFKRKGLITKTRTLFLNGAVAAVTTFATVHLLGFLFGSISEISKNGTPADFVKILCAMALAQFFFNSAFVSVFTALKDDRSPWKIWYKNCLNALIIYAA